ncbi:phosphopyruvate hydratase [Fumia xinanensis]|uniref:Enolase n=1 Tax=Fumia xinanensis TaxID=2763659 RepID=A0A926E2Q5_9FIRM|nr:phosphopyruvate hydratase [Fumia xinanensis]MBC8558445.1 phosphopyruvate hydratase [Fumia xinanensis]
MNITSIKKVSGRQIFDSRGTPTVEATVELQNGLTACASVPSGASTGQYEACELRDGGKEYQGKGVEKAVSNINGKINSALQGKCIFGQQELDQTMIALDGTDNKSRLGANAILAVSLACAKAGAKASNMEFYRYLGGMDGVTLPVPMMNILNGGAHASNNVDIQEFMIRPVGAQSFREAMKIGTEVYHQLKKVLHSKGLSTTVGDEGGFAPDLEDDEQALQLLVEAIEGAGYQPGKEVNIAIDAAASEWFQNGKYFFPKKKKELTREELISYFERFCEKYPVVSIEDPLGEEDFPGFTEITRQIGNKVQIVGDDLFVTNPKRLQKGIEQQSANAILIKPNQIGSLSETMLSIRLAQQNGYQTIISHRSGETEDTSIADISVALNAGQIKTGAPARTDRVCKYNRLLKIEQLLGDAAVYPSSRSR